MKIHDPITREPRSHEIILEELRALSLYGVAGRGPVNVERKISWAVLLIEELLKEESHDNRN